MKKPGHAPHPHQRVVGELSIRQAMPNDRAEHRKKRIKDVDKGRKHNKLGESAARGHGSMNINKKEGK